MTQRVGRVQNAVEVGNEWKYISSETAERRARLGETRHATPQQLIGASRLCTHTHDFPGAPAQRLRKLGFLERL